MAVYHARAVVCTAGAAGKGGQWHLLDGPLIERVVGFSFLLVVVALLGFAGHLTANQLNTANVSANGLRFALVVGLVNYFATVVLISRSWDYDVFVVPVFYQDWSRPASI